MKRELFVGTLLSPLCASVGLAGQGCERPNILVILADDLARCELSCYGGQNLRTPHIDKVADEG
ncbi:MAG: arylsulfatase, partial [Bacteroidaceae bacterium]